MRQRRWLVVVTYALFACAAALLAVGGVFRQPSLGRRPYVLSQHADASRLEAVVRHLTEDLHPRDSAHPGHLARAASYLAHELARYDDRVELEPFTVEGHEYFNVVARFGPPSGTPVVVGAHYDAFSMFGDLPGADDNASGTAGLLEVARLLSGVPLTRPVEIVAFSLEEPPYFASPHMGSAVYAAGLQREGRKVTAMLCLEMIGYFSEHQPWPSRLLGLIYPHHGDFIAVVGRWQDRRLARRVKRAMRAARGVPPYSYSGPVTSGVDASDQRNFWSRGWPAVMVTDTAFVRNPNYHAVTDRADTLDYGRMAQVVDGVANAVVDLGGVVGAS